MFKIGRDNNVCGYCRQICPDIIDIVTCSNWKPLKMAIGIRLCTIEKNLSFSAPIEFWPIPNNYTQRNGVRLHQKTIYTFKGHIPSRVRFKHWHIINGFGIIKRLVWQVVRFRSNFPDPLSSNIIYCEQALIFNHKSSCKWLFRIKCVSNRNIHPRRKIHQGKNQS